MTQAQLSPRYVRNSYVLAILTGIASLLACWAALVRFPIPNLSMVFYGLALLCCWKLVTFLQWQGQFFCSSSKKRQQSSCFFALLSCVFLYASVLSCYSTYKLFPHPMVHAILAGAIYINGGVLALWLGKWAWDIWHNRLDSWMKVRAKIFQEEERNLQKRWQQSQQISQHQLAQASEQLEKASGKTFLINKVKFLRLRFTNLILWAILPGWIFVLVPWQSQEKFTALPTFFQFSIVATLLFFGGWAVQIMLRATFFYKISPQGIFWQKYSKKGGAFWEQTKEITLEEDELIFEFWNSEKLTVPIFEVSDYPAFLAYLFHVKNLTPDVFFIGESMWYRLQKEYQNVMEERQKISGKADYKKIQEFLERYKEVKLSQGESQKVTLQQEKQESPPSQKGKRGKKRKKGKKKK